MSATRDNIEKHGWESVYVFDEKGAKQPYIYSIGLEETFNHPEIVIYGLAKETMHGILSDIVHNLRAGAVFEKDIRVSNIISADYEVMFKDIKQQHFPEFLGTATRYYKKPFKAWVMFWPDKNNVLPTEEGCELDLQNEALQIV